MIYPSVLERRYQEYHPFLEEVAKRVKSTILNFCEDNSYAFISRVKTVESLAEKIETGRFEAWSELNDLFACTVIVPTLSYEQEVIDFCKATFAVVKTTKRGQNRKAPDTFKFDSTRLYASLKRPDDVSTSEAINIFDIKFEIQIRSAFEHAWSVSTHALTYKSSEVDWKRLRLTAQIKATVEQLDTLILGFEQMALNISESPWTEIKDKCKFAKIVNSFFKQNKIPIELTPKDMSRFCDNLYNFAKSSGTEVDIQSIITCLEREINSMSIDKIPRSISLFQYFLAILISQNLVTLPLKRYVCHVTSELITLYPSLNNIDSVFAYEK
jgi:ppGpp synthetase/RelA/SpoT-type nucleotidyltranferase